MDTNKSYIDRHMNVDDDNIRNDHNRRLNASKGFVVKTEDKVIGCYFMMEMPDSFELGRFFLISEVQNKKLGTRLVKEILEEYKTIQKPILIHVWKDNPVRTFWEKFGFVVHEENDPFIDLIYHFRKAA